MKIVCQVTQQEVSVNVPQLKNTAETFKTTVNDLKAHYVGREGRDKLRVMTIEEAKQKYPNVLQSFLERYCSTKNKVSISDLVG
jgi:hypothetical protein